MPTTRWRIDPSALSRWKPARVSRVELVQARAIWKMQGITFAGLCLVTTALAFALPPGQRGPLLGLAAMLALIGVVFLSIRTPPAMGTAGNHASLLSVYGSIGVAELAFAPDWTVPLGAAMFIGPLAAMRLQDRRQIVAHLAAASICLAVPAAIEDASSSAVVGVAAVIIAVWALAGIVAFLLELTEAQGRELEVLLRRDALTGVGNQRLFDERLETELGHHARLRQSMSIIAIDLTEFSELNERFGRTSCDELLGQAAAAIGEVLRPEATLARPVADEFWVVLPSADRVASSDTVSEVRWALASVALPTQTTGLAAAIGIAAYPADGVRPAALVDVARSRMVADRESGHYEPPPITEVARSRPAPAAPSVPPLVRGLSRQHLAEHPMLWRFAFAAYGAITVLAALTVAVGHRGGGDHWLVAVACVAVSALTVVRRGPALDGLRNHAFLASTYCGSAIGMWALQPDGGVALAVALFVAPLIAVRLQTRSAIVGHLAAASVVFAAVAVAGASYGSLDRETILGICLLSMSIWSLGISCMFGLELAEQQGRELEQLVRVDPVTGVGNRHMLDESLGESIERHRTTERTMSLVLLELVETFENSREASDLLLQTAAQTISEALGPDDVVVRRRGHEFAIILPNARPGAASHTIAGIESSLAELARRGHRMETVHAIARFPEDGRTPAALLTVADRRLRGHATPLG